MDLEEKRKILLQNLEKLYQKFEFQKFEKLSGPGMMRKIQRLLFCPSIYIPYLLFKLNLFPKTKTKSIKLLNFKKMTIEISDFGSFILSKFGILYGLPEYKLTKFFIKNLKENDIFYDVGANYGFYTHLAIEFCQEVHAFEPLPDVFESLKNNFQNNPKVHLNNLAISNKNGNLELFVAGGGSTIIEEVATKIKIKNNKIVVKTITLDDYIKTHNPPTIIKMDVEGAESLVIEGGKEFLKNNNPIIAMEVWSGEEGKNFSMKAVEKLWSLGFKSYYINKKGDLEKIDKDLSEKVYEEGLSNDNFIFLKIN